MPSKMRILPILILTGFGRLGSQPKCASLPGFSFGVGSTAEHTSINDTSDLWKIRTARTMLGIWKPSTTSSFDVPELIGSG